MVRYSDLVNYTKQHHINWNTDLFEVLKGFFKDYSPPPHFTPHVSQKAPIIESSPQQEIIFSRKEFKEPENGEYTSEDLINLFSSLSCLRNTTDQTSSLLHIASFLRQGLNTRTMTGSISKKRKGISLTRLKQWLITKSKRKIS